MEYENMVLNMKYSAQIKSSFAWFYRRFKLCLNLQRLGALRFWNKTMVRHFACKIASATSWVGAEAFALQSCFRDKLLSTRWKVGFVWRLTYKLCFLGFFYRIHYLLPCLRWNVANWCCFVWKWIVATLVAIVWRHEVCMGLIEFS